MISKERLDQLDKMYLEYSDILDASSYDVSELIASAREAHRLRDGLAAHIAGVRVSIEYGDDEFWHEDEADLLQNLLDGKEGE